MYVGVVVLQTGESTAPPSGQKSQPLRSNDHFIALFIYAIRQYVHNLNPDVSIICLFIWHHKRFILEIIIHI